MKQKPKFVVTYRQIVMTILLLMIGMVILWALTGCQKEEPISYTGEYDGTWSYSTPYFQQSDRYAYRSISENENGYFILTNWGNGAQTANSSLKGYSYDAFEILANNSCEMQFVTITGNGTFVGDSLFENGELIFTTSQGIYKGTWNSKLKKRN